jgi:hypothetical protein
MPSIAMSVLDNDYANYNGGWGGNADRKTKREWWDGIKALQMVTLSSSTKITGHSIDCAVGVFDTGTLALA